MASTQEAAGNKSSEVSDEPTPAKQPRLDQPTASQESTAMQQHDFTKFRLVEILDNSQRAKYVALLGKFDTTARISSSSSSSSSQDGKNGEDSKSNSTSAILLLEKEAFPIEQLQQSQLGLSLFDHRQTVETVMHNDIWHKYRLPLESSFCLAKATLVHPATDRLAAKYRRRPCHLVVESPEDYRKRTEPALKSAGAKHSLAWVGNLLDGSAEADRLVFDDPDPAVGFVLHADLKWDGRQIDDLYCLAVCRVDGLHSLRQLGAQHLPLLENLMDKGRKALRDRYGVPLSQQRVFLHYQPSFYHLHAHFTHVSADWPGQQAERAHLVTEIINNIRLMPDYYQKATLTFPVKEGEPLYDAYKDQLDLL
ncbi:hypothetical protein BOX15_Mlig029688g1 [Macrostomum lignano]|uniref:Uncharacterized protein n=2 Tax=Macrostomum lignano TaxID=282301 RepID=A0A267F9T7_9PLAT|nr:hypothetical protein BOX15_Mlig029688g1 [Macrostomum lignano]